MEQGRSGGYRAINSGAGAGVGDGAVWEQEQEQEQEKFSLEVLEAGVLVGGGSVD